MNTKSCLFLGFLATPIACAGTAGGLRDVDRLATATLKAAARAGLQRVDRALLLNVVNAHKR